MSPMRFSVSTRETGDVTVVTITGAIMYAEAHALHEMFSDLISKGRKKFLLNLGGVTHLDSSGIGALARAFTTVRKANGELKMVDLSKQVERLLDMTNLYKIFEDYTDEESALRSFR
jgi:anti-sigma B factor antagonist